MATSANGWPVLFDNRTTGELPRLRRFVLPDADRHLYARDGSAGFILCHFALWWHDRVNPLSGRFVWDEWGWAVRPVRGQTSGYSNHASATAVDLDATQFPRGVPILRNMKPYQVARIRRRIRTYRANPKDRTAAPVLTWGGDYQRTVDGMHVEISPGTPMRDVEAVARRLMRHGRGRQLLAANPGLDKVILS